MIIVDLFSKRQKKLRGEVPDIYQYEDIPQSFRIQIVQIIEDAFGGRENRSTKGNFYTIHKILAREYGVFSLGEKYKNDFNNIYDYFISCDDYERVLDIIELSFKMINIYLRTKDLGFSYSPDDAINELNFRFKEHRIGYQFESNELIRIDSKFLHSETVKPVLLLLGNEQRFNGANEEFLNAHEHYRHGRYKECLVECLKSFESVMKAICDKQNWQYNKGDTAKSLIAVCFKNDLLPGYMETQFSGIHQLLESGIPTVRNKLAAYGQGTEIVNVTETMVSYTLHLTATNILFLCNLERDNFS